MDEDEVDPLDAFMEENDQETVKDIQQTYLRAGMLTVELVYRRKDHPRIFNHRPRKC